MTPIPSPEQLTTRLFTIVMLGVAAFVAAVVALLALAQGAGG